MSPNGQYVYVVNYGTDGSGGISQYTVGAGGALQPMSTPTVAAGNGPWAVAVSPNGQYVYVTNYATGASGGISQYTVGAGGALQPMSTPTVTAGNGPWAVAVSPNGQYVYVTNVATDGSGGISQYTVGAGGALQPMSTPTVTARQRAGRCHSEPERPVRIRRELLRGWVGWGVAVHGRGGGRAAPMASPRSRPATPRGDRGDA